MAKASLIAAALAAACSTPASSTGPILEPEKPKKAPLLDCDVELVYLANAGVLLRTDKREVMIDGLHRPFGDAYAVLPEAERARLEGAEDPWAGVDLIISTHEHGDHHSHEAVAAHLKANTGATFVGPPALAQKLRSAATSNPNIFSIPWGPGSSGLLPNVPNLEILNLNHVGGIKDVENIGVVVTIGGIAVFHPGDASAEVTEFEPFEGLLADIDAALLPPWFFAGDKSAWPVRARRLYAMHIDPRRAIEVAARARVNDVTPLTEMLAPAPLCRPPGSR